MTRAGTLLFALMILQAQLGVLCVVAGRSEQNLAALRLWGWGLVIHAAGLALLMIPALPPAVGQMGGNALIALSPVVGISGVLGHSRVRLRLRWLGLGLAASIVPILINHTQPSPSAVTDVFATTPVAVVLFLLAAWALTARPAARTVWSSRLVAVALGLAALTWTLRIATAWPPDDATVNGYSRADAVVSLFAIGQMVAAVTATFGLLWIDVRRMGATLDRLVNTDPLTGLPNSRAALKRFADEVARAARHDRSFALVLLEIDRFKSIRDMRGPLACDAVVRHVAGALRRGMRAEDVPSYLGANAFVVLLPEQAKVGAAQSSDRLRELVAAKPCSFDAWPLNVTVSSGQAVFPADGRNWDELFTIASRRLSASRPGGQREG